jgi:hypothetical protein
MTLVAKVLSRPPEMSERALIGIVMDKNQVKVEAEVKKNGSKNKTLLQNEVQ